MAGENANFSDKNVGKFWILGLGVIFVVYFRPHKSCRYAAGVPRTRVSSAYMYVTVPQRCLILTYRQFITRLASPPVYKV